MASTIDLSTYPTERSDATEDRSSELFSSLISKGVIVGVGDELEVFADSTGMHVKVRSGRGTSAGFWGDSPDEELLDIGTAHSTQPRIDSVVMRLDRTSPATLSLHIEPGTAAASPSAPTLDDEDIWLGDVLVSAGVSTIASNKITDRRVFAQPGPTVSDRTVFRGDSASAMFYDLAGSARASVGLREDVSSSSEDLILYVNTGDVRLYPGGTESVLFPASSTDVALSVLGKDVDMAGGGIVRFTSAATTASANAGGGSLPASPAGFLKIKVDGTERKVPYYAS